MKIISFNAEALGAVLTVTAAECVSIDYLQFDFIGGIQYVLKAGSQVIPTTDAILFIPWHRILSITFQKDK